MPVFCDFDGTISIQDATDLTKLAAMQKAGDVKWDVVYAGGSPVANACGKMALNIDPTKVDISDSVAPPPSPCPTISHSHTQEPRLNNRGFFPQLISCATPHF